MTPGRDVENLVRRCVEGDREAQAELFADYSPLVRTAVLRQLTRLNAGAAGFADADDMTQGVLERLLADDCRLLRTLHRPRSLKAWLVTVARNHVIDQLKSATTRARYETDYSETQLGIGPTVSEKAAVYERSEFVRHALNALSADDRIVLELYYVDGLRYAEIADVLHLNINTLSARLRRAKARLRQTIEEGGDAERS